MKNFGKDKRDRLLMTGIATVIGVVAIYYFLIGGQRVARKAITKQITEQKLKVTSAERLVATTSAMKQDLDIATQKLTAIEDGMASGDMYAWVIQTVGRFGAERKVDIPQFSREITADVGMFAKFPYKAAIFNVRGSAYYHDLGKFLADFENAFPFARVQNLDLEPGTGSAATATADAEKLAFRMEIVTLINPNVR